MGILGNLFGMSEDNDIGARIALASQALMAMDQGQVANIAPSLAVLNERRRKVMDEAKSQKWLQNQAAAMADKNPRLAQMLQDAPPEMAQGLISRYIQTLPEFQLPDWKTFDDGTGNIMRYDANNANSKPELFFDGPAPMPDGELGQYLTDQKAREARGLPTQLFAEWKTSMQKPENRFRPATMEEKKQFGVTPETPLAIEEGSGKPMVISGNGVTINNGSKYGTIPPGYQLVEGPEGAKLIPIPGSPAEAEQAAKVQKAEGAASQKQQNVDLVTQEIDRSISILDNDTWYNPATGLGATAAARIGGTNAANLKALTQTIGSVITLDGIKNMRQNSPTGAAMGAVSDADLALLRNALGSVEQSQGEDQLRFNLNRLWNLYQDTIHGPNGGPPRRPLDPAVEQQQDATNFDPDDVATLKGDPSPEAMADFDSHYGPGAARRALGGQ